MNQPTSTQYWVRRTGHDLIELRQTRFRAQFERDVEHPHDVCAYFRSIEEGKDTVERYKLGTVDWTLQEATA